MDSAVHHAGRQSLLVSAERPASVEIVSEPVDLQVGRPYRLGAGFEPKRHSPIPRPDTLRPFPPASAWNPSPSRTIPPPWGRFRLDPGKHRLRGDVPQDRVRIHFGANGAATGKIWIDDLELEEVQDLRDLISPEAVRWASNGFRYDDGGWIFVHTEGAPYERGYQFGYLLAQEMGQFISKVSILETAKTPRRLGTSSGSWPTRPCSASTTRST